MTISEIASAIGATLALLALVVTIALANLAQAYEPSCKYAYKLGGKPCHPFTPSGDDKASRP